jgi:hypothetical protein
MQFLGAAIPMTYPSGRAVAGRRSRNGWLAGTVARSAGAGIALSVAALLWAPTALADNATNEYTASVTPASITTGAHGSFTVTVTDAAVSQANLQLVDVTVPSGFTALALGAVTQPAGAGFAATLTGNVVALNTAGPGLSPGQSVSVAITATAPQVPGSYTWGTAVQHAGGFTLLGPAPAVNVTPPPPAALAIVGQPSTTQLNTAMSPAVVVDVYDSSGHIDTGYNGPVTLSYAVNPPNAPLPANNVVSASSGVATFSALTFSAVGFGFELQASVPGLTSAPSQQFDIDTQVVTCPGGQSCQSQTVSSDGTSGFAVAGAGSASDVLTATGGGFPRLSCTAIGGVLTFTDSNRPMTITLMLAKDLVEQAISSGASHFYVCWGSPTPFTTRAGTTSMFNAANNEYEGLLPDCSVKGPPCVEDMHKTNAGVEVATISSPPGDPRPTW